MTASPYLESRGPGFVVAGTRVGLDVIVYTFRRGETAEAIFQAFPSIGSLAKVYGVITFILEHPEEIETYLCEQERRWEEFREKHPIPEHLLQRLNAGQKIKV